MPDDDVSAFTRVLVGPSDAEIVALEADLRRAQLAADVGALDRLISEDLLFTAPNGALATKAQDLAAHQTGSHRVREHEPLELRIRRVGPDVVIVSLLARMAVMVRGSLAHGAFRYTRVWAREDGTWRIAAGHVAPASDNRDGS
jgi:ketosteroid isomerase-like protein